MHGKTSEIYLDPMSPIFKGLKPVTTVGRYHSLAADKERIPDDLNVTARTEDGEIMAVSHRSLPIYGLQFHPESILTPEGKTMIKNFLSL